jgi:hypothetical protein
MNSNPDIVNGINPNGSHTSLFGVSVGGRKRRYKSLRHKKSKLRRKHTRKYKSRRQRRYRRQRGGINPTYRSYSASFEPGHNGIYANGPSVGNIIEQFN